MEHVDSLSNNEILIHWIIPEVKENFTENSLRHSEKTILSKTPSIKSPPKTAHSHFSRPKAQKNEKIIDIFLIINYFMTIVLLLATGKSY